MARNVTSLILFRVIMLFVIAGLVVTISSCDFLNTLLGVEDNGDSNGLDGDEFEPNDSWQEASPLSLAADYSASISENEDVDFYEITTAHASDTFDKVEFFLGAGSADLLFHFEVYSTSGEKLLGATADTPGQNFTYTLACPGGTFLFRVSGWDEIMNRDNGSHGPYTVTVTNLDANDAQAPNHTQATAASVSFDTSYPGTIVSIYEDDWYTVSNTDSDRWERFQMRITDVATDLAAGYFIYDAAQTEIYANNSATSAFTKGADQIYSFASKSSDFFFRVCGWNNVMHRPYGSSGTYSFEVLDLNANDDFEPDDTLANAREVTTFSADYAGTIVVDAANDNGGDYEWFKVNIADGTNIAWSVDPADTNTELHFNVYNASQTPLGQEDGLDGETIGGNMDNISGSDSYFYIELGAFVGDTGNYTISFTETAL